MRTLQLLSTTDARVWAAEFVRMHGGDEGLLTAWFANAIETGRTAGEQARTPQAENDSLEVGERVEETQ